MAYTPTYVISDVAPITVDLAATFLAAITGQAGVIAQLAVLLIVISLILGLIGGVFALLNTKFFKQ